MTTSTHDVAVCIGRFQILHNGQLAVLRRALALAPRVLVLLGSAHQARTPRNPLTWQERADMIGLALSDSDRTRIEFVPLRDYWDHPRWVGVVRRLVGERVPQGARVVLVGHRKDATSAYLGDFPDWTLDDIGSQGELHAKSLRDSLFTGHSVDASLAVIASQVPPGTVNFLRAWARMPFFDRLREEWHGLVHEKSLWRNAPYPPVLVTVDAVIRAGDRVLLIRRGRAPGKGLLALPGGFLEQRETVYQSALRELEEETGLRLWPDEMAHALRGVRVFDHPDRSQRGRVITHAHYFDLGNRMAPEVAGSDDAEDARWVDIATLPSLEDQFHDDHFHILDAFLGLTEPADVAGARSAAQPGATSLRTQAA